MGEWEKFPCYIRGGVFLADLRFFVEAEGDGFLVVLLDISVICAGDLTRQKNYISCSTANIDSSGLGHRV